jgi:hypothetical protein
MKIKPEKSIIIKNGRRLIKINGEWIYYNRWLFEKEVRPLRQGEIVHHKDEDKLNDCIENYEAMSLSKHTKLHHKGKKCKPISNKTRIKLRISHIGKIFSNKTKKKLSLMQKGENNSNSILNSNDVKNIRHIYFWGKKITQLELAKKYNVRQTTISEILQGRSWNNNKLTKDQLIKKSKILRIPIKEI